MRVCIITNCSNTNIAGYGWCWKHYNRWRHHKNPNYVKQITTRLANPSEYTTWSSMKQRCVNPNSVGYKHYGGRGIKVCDRWLESFENFFSDMGKRPSGKHTLDRIDNDGNYEPGNCKWSDWREQISNRRLNHTNTSGHSGVSWDKARKVWRVDINVDGKQKNIGRFKDIDCAIKARIEAEHKLLV